MSVFAFCSSVLASLLELALANGDHGRNFARAVARDDTLSPWNHSSRIVPLDGSRPGCTRIGRRDLGLSTPTLRKCISVERSKLYGPRGCRVDQNRLGLEICLPVADIATQETAPIGHFILLGVSCTESPDVSVDSGCDRSVAESVSGGVDGC